jgi:hypothetical protein
MRAGDGNRNRMTSLEGSVRCYGEYLWMPCCARTLAVTGLARGAALVQILVVNPSCLKTVVISGA